MTLSYQTGTVSGSAALLTTIGTFLTGLGATVYDAVSSTDKVYAITSAISGRVQYWRFTCTTDTNNPIKHGKERTRDGVIAREYVSWNATTHAGTMRSGRAGPFVVGAANAIGGSIQTLRMYDDFTKWPYTNTVNWSIGALAPGLGFSGFAGPRLAWYVPTATTYIFQDLNTGESWTSATCPGSISGNQGQYVVHSDGSEYIYALSSVGVFYRYSIAANTWTALAVTPWNTTSVGGVVLWDGGDLIYVAQGNATTAWAKYSISGNNWTSLTALPVARSASWSSYASLVYIPATSSGLGYDAIVGGLDYNSANFRQYNVTAGTWSVSTAPITFGNAGGASVQSVAFDDSRYIYFLSSGVGTVWGLDVQTLASPTFVNLGTLLSAAQPRTDFNYPLTGVVHTSISAQTTYYFLGDTETLVVGGTEGGRDSYFSIGMYDSFQNSAIMTTTLPVIAGYSTTIAVDDSSKYPVGSVVGIVGADGSNYETTTILSITDAHHIVANLTIAHGANSLIGQDVLPYTVTSGIGLATTPLDGKGYQTDFINATWRCYPMFGVQALGNTTPGADGLYQLSPMLLSGPPFSGAASNQNAANGYAVMSGSGSHQLNKGTLRYVYAFGTGGMQVPVSGQQIIANDGKTYMCLRPNTEYAFAAGSVVNHGIAIGPIN